MHANRGDEETRQSATSLSLFLSLSCARGLPVNTECTRESGYAIIPLQLFYTNAECRYSKDYTVRRERQATPRNGTGFSRAATSFRNVFAIERRKETETSVKFVNFKRDGFTFDPSRLLRFPAAFRNRR